jgi:predicted transcriptional regulator YdeE
VVKTRIVNLPGFVVVGISARTKNSKEMSGGAGVIGPMWHRFTTEPLLQSIPDKAAGYPVAVYSDYKVGEDLEFTFTVGAKVNSAVNSNAKLPAGMSAVTVPGGRFAVLTTERGLGSIVIPNAWMQIWQASPGELGGERAFTTDYELYDKQMTGPEDSIADIYVALK